MKTSLIYILLASSTVLFSCGSKDDDPAPEPPTSESSWKLGTYSYNRGASSQSNTGGLAGMTVTTSGDGGNHGAYSGSSLTIIFQSSLGAGKYTLTSSSIMSANPNVRYMSLLCTVGTASGIPDLNLSRTSC